MSRRKAYNSARLFFLSCFVLFQTTPAQSQNNEAGLETLLNQVDNSKAWSNTPVSGVPAQTSPQSYPKPYFGRQSYARSPGQLSQLLKNYTVWRPAANLPANSPGSNGGMTGPMDYLPPNFSGQNPYNLSPFGMLHYMWDPTTYVSSGNPMTTTDVRSDLQQANNNYQLALAAARRARYDSDSSSKSQAAEQAQYYANAARTAADRATSETQSASLDEKDLAAQARDAANKAQYEANQANADAHGGGW